MSRYDHSHRSNLFKAATERGIDAEKLFEAGRYAGAVYMAGYKVECTLKVALMEVANVDDLRGLEDWLVEQGQRTPHKILHNLEVLSQYHPGVQELLSHPGRRHPLELIRARNECNRWKSEARYSSSNVDSRSARIALDAVQLYSRFLKNEHGS